MVISTPARSADLIAQQLGERVRAMREDLGLSQRQLAEMAGMDATTLSNIERGGNPRLSSLIGLASALRLPSVELLFGPLVLPRDVRSSEPAP